ncbi:hypothetical protein NDU88_007306 [Pleurodeles waltl]|uniref:Uncharacterized protein n=1 Tax=Pleurodeles waltl TaxID=8319 RepID=A0AAV7SS45_PLEWA|nr:hypothetical protein NDU88_007306 [Pleurodeles waltl]
MHCGVAVNRSGKRRSVHARQFARSSREPSGTWRTELPAVLRKVIGVLHPPSAETPGRKSAASAPLGLPRKQPDRVRLAGIKRPTSLHKTAGVRHRRRASEREARPRQDYSAIIVAGKALLKEMTMSDLN